MPYCCEGQVWWRWLGGKKMSEDRKLEEVLYDTKVPEGEFEQILSDHLESGRQISLGELYFSPNVSSERFREVLRHYVESGNLDEALPYLRKFKQRYLMSRRRFMGYAAIFGTTLALGGFAGCTQQKAEVPAGKSPTDKAIKKGKLGLGAISVLDCEGYGYIIKEKRILEEMGYDMNYVYVPTSPTLVEAFMAGEINGLYPGACTVAMAVEKGIALKNAATAMIAHGGWSIRKELAEKEDISNMDEFFEYAKQRKAEGNPVKVATQVPATTTYLWYGVTCLKYGMDPEKDFDVKMLPPAEVALSIISGRVEAQSICEQWDTYPEYYGQTKIIGHGISERPYCMFGHIDAKDENSYGICTTFAYNPNLDAQAKRDYIEAQRKAVQFMHDEPLEAMKLMSKISKTPLTVEYVGLFRRPRWQVDIWYYSLEQGYKGFQKLGLAKGGLKLEDWVDTEFATGIEPPYPSLAGFIDQDGPVDVVSDAFVKQVYEDAKKFIGKGEF